MTGGGWVFLGVARSKTGGDRTVRCRPQHRMVSAGTPRGLAAGRRLGHSDCMSTPMRTADADRLELAAQLQDVIAHRITALEVQAAAAGRLAMGTSPAATEALRAVLRLGHEAMSEVRRLGRLLDDGAPAAMQPAPTLASLEELLGMRVEAEVPPGVALCAYRCAELLTRTGGGVTVRVVGEQLRLGSGAWPDGDGAARLRTLVKPCGGELRLLGDGTCRIDLPLAS